MNYFEIVRICLLSTFESFVETHIPHNDIKTSKDAQWHGDCCTVPKLFDLVYVSDTDLPEHILVWVAFASVGMKMYIASRTDTSQSS